ncbi:cyclodeaminase [Halobacillus salinarum]|uniref:Cyclodeaminase n=1 Tax=Halobacillus salinarum TaxID=2932257 RepID=A0ABY4ELZ7_9BACI|nr:cyclodeaminase [Halobacillus salinarum]UOQ45106.1 cyclodeaminase [Halobacillus salinarum]
MHLFNRDQIEKVVQLNKEVIQVIEDAFTALQTKSVQMPPIMRVDVPEHNGEVDIKSAYISGYDSFAVKLSSGFFNNPQKGLPSANGLMILLSSETGMPKAVLADNGLLTDIRTAAAGAVAARHLSRKDSKTAGVIGAGAQARLQLEALMQVRSIERVLVFGRRQEQADVYKEDMERKLGVDVIVCRSPETVVTESDIVMTTTPAKEPIIKAEWMHPGLHITAMGSDAEHKQELEAKAVLSADLFTCDVKSQSLRLGEMRMVHENDKAIQQALELGEITSGQKQGRSNSEQITICDLTGTGVQDTAIARFAFELLDSKGGVYR